jgi:hypothetical protein
MNYFFIEIFCVYLWALQRDQFLKSERKPILEWDPMPPDDSLNAPDDCYWVVLETIDELLLLLRKVKISLTIHEF